MTRAEEPFLLTRKETKVLLHFLGMASEHQYPHLVEVLTRPSGFSQIFAARKIASSDAFVELVTLVGKASFVLLDLRQGSKGALPKGTPKEMQELDEVLWPLLGRVKNCIETHSSPK